MIEFPLFFTVCVSGKVSHAHKTFVVSTKMFLHDNSVIQKAYLKSNYKCFFLRLPQNVVHLRHEEEGLWSKFKAIVLQNNTWKTGFSESWPLYHQILQISGTEPLTRLRRFESYRWKILSTYKQLEQQTRCLYQLLKKKPNQTTVLLFQQNYILTCKSSCPLIACRCMKALFTKKLWTKDHII